MKTISKQEWVKDPVVRGLYQRVTSKSSTWAIKARRKGFSNVVTVTIGSCAVIPTRLARNRAKEILAQLSDGIDPNDLKRSRKLQEERAKQEEIARSMTLAQALDSFLAIGDRKALTIKDCRQTIERNFGDWLNKSIHEIKGSAVQERFLEIQRRVKEKRDELNRKQSQKGQSLTQFKNRDGQGEAQRAFRYLRAIFNMLKADEINGKPLIDRNPVDILKAKKLTKVLIPRDRYLLPSEREELIYELSHVDHREYQGPLSSDDCEFVYLILMTGLRVDEARQLQWQDVNFPEGIFTARDTKNRRNHTLPMTDGVKRILSSRKKRLRSSSIWVFPSPQDKSKCSSMSRTFERLNKATSISFTAHDLRRTVATIASEMGYDLERIGAVLNHKKTGITSRYVQTTLDSLRETLQSVEDMVLLRR